MSHYVNQPGAEATAVKPLPRSQSNFKSRIKICCSCMHRTVTLLLIIGVMAPSRHFSVQENSQSGSSSKSLKLIIALVTVVLLVVGINVIVGLWQTGVIFSNAANNIAKDVVNVTSQSVVKNTTQEAATNDFTNDDATSSYDHTIYFATVGSGIKELSTNTSQVTTRKDSAEPVYAVAFDALRNKLYWTSNHTIYRSVITETNVETLLDSTQYGLFRGLGWDRIGVRLYVVTEGGFMIVCDARAVRNGRCVVVLSNQGALYGIAIDSDNGTMYFTKSNGSIMKAHMDGSSLTTFVSGLSSPKGVVIDHIWQRLYWADSGPNVIQYSSLEGGEVTTLCQTSSAPWGIAVADQRLYWSVQGEIRATNGSEIGGRIHMLYNGSSSVTGLVIKDSVLPSSSGRESPCRGEPCGGVCVITPTSFTCLL